MKITLKEWLNEFNKELDAIQKDLAGSLEKKKTNELLQDMQYIYKELLVAQTSTFSFLSHLNSAKTRSDKYFSNNELIEANIPTDKVTKSVLIAYRNYANRWNDVTDKPKTSFFPGAPDYEKRSASIDKFLSKLDITATPDLRMTR